MIDRLIIGALGRATPEVVRGVVLPLCSAGMDHARGEENPVPVCRRFVSLVLMYLSIKKSYYTYLLSYLLISIVSIVHKQTNNNYRTCIYTRSPNHSLIHTYLLTYPASPLSKNKNSKPLPQARLPPKRQPPRPSPDPRSEPRQVPLREYRALRVPGGPLRGARAQHPATSRRRQQRLQTCSPSHLGRLRRVPRHPRLPPVPAVPAGGGHQRGGRGGEARRVEGRVQEYPERVRRRDAEE